jgi:SAM-dependent methyltransferase
MRQLISRFAPASLICLLLFACQSARAAAVPDVLSIPIPGKHSIVRVGAVPDNITADERTAAQTFWEGLGEGNHNKIRAARDQFSKFAEGGGAGGDASALAWMAEMLLTEGGGSRAALESPLDRAFYDYFLGDAQKNLKDYLQRKYQVDGFLPSDPEEHLTRRHFLEDLILFNNPRRAMWEPVEEIVGFLREYIRPGDSVVDVGAGFGYFAHRLGQLVGDAGVVHAIDVEKTYIDYMTQLAADYRLSSISPALSAEDDIRIQGPVDAVFMASLYHVVYTWSAYEKQRKFLASIRKALRDDGVLLVLDNTYRQGDELHQSFVNSDYVTAQLHYYGFELKEKRDIGGNRYLLAFKATSAPKPPAFAAEPGRPRINVESGRSVVHVGSLDSYDTTAAGTEAARLLLKALSEGDRKAAWQAIELYDELIPAENFGGEYTALRWFAEHFVAPEAQKRELTSYFLTRAYFHYLADNNYERLRSYLTRKYKLGKSDLTPAEAVDEDTLKVGQTIRQELEDFILFNNPRREQWEKTSAILEALPLRPGMTVIDLGSGPGYFSFKFAERVGDSGLVYAMDTKSAHLEFLKEVADQNQVKNIRVFRSEPKKVEFPPGVEADMIFLCSIYHSLYAVESLAFRDELLNGLRAALAPGGRLVIVDNGPVEDNQLPYHGPYIRPELIIAQLAEYGLRLVDQRQIIPQRYLLVFEADSGATVAQGSVGR